MFLSFVFVFCFSYFLSILIKQQVGIIHKNRKKNSSVCNFHRYFYFIFFLFTLCVTYFINFFFTYRCILYMIFNILRSDFFFFFNINSECGMNYVKRGILVFLYDNIYFNIFSTDLYSREKLDQLNLQEKINFLFS